jgi:hypothetical protein
VTHTFDYIDMMSQQVVGVYEQERERWLADRTGVCSDSLAVVRREVWSA